MSVAAYHKAVQALLSQPGDFKAAIGGRIFYQEEKPATPQMPFAAWFTVYSEPSDTFSAQIDERMIQISIFTASLSECLTIADKAAALLDGATLTGAGIQPARLVRGSKIGPMKTEDNGRQMILEYTVLVQPS